MRRKVIYPVMMASAVGLSVAWADDTAQEKKKEEVTVTAVVVNDDKPIQVRGQQIVVTNSDQTADANGKKVVIVKGGETIDVKGEKIVVGKLWLGVGLKSIEGDLSEYLDTDKGVLIEDVHEGSPAAKANIKKGDIVLAVDAKELKGPDDLLEVMKSAQADVALTLKIRRKNDEIEVKVTPEPRPSEVTMGIDLSNLQREIGEDANFTFEMLDPQKLQVFRMGHPAGVIAHAGSAMKGDLQLHIVNKQDGKSLEVKVNREGDKPATIIVTKDGETKTYTEEQIGELPEEIRGMVSPMLHSGGPAVFSFTGNLDQLKSLDSLKKGFKLNLDLHHDEAMAHAQKALQHALEQVASGADHAKAAADALNSPEFRKQMDEIRAKVSAQVSEAAAKAAEDAKVMKEKVKQMGADAKQQAKSSSNKAEVEELRAMVEQLKKEIAELKAASKDK